MTFHLLGWLGLLVTDTPGSSRCLQTQLNSTFPHTPRHMPLFSSLSSSLFLLKNKTKRDVLTQASALTNSGQVGQMESFIGSYSLASWLHVP